MTDEITLINFAHPISQAQIEQIENLLQTKVGQTFEPKSQVDVHQPLGQQVVSMVDSIHLTPEAWQTLPILINPPALNHSAILLMAELHGRMGRFPTCLRLRPVKNAIPRRYEIAEIASPQMVRDTARKRREAKA